MSIIFGLLIVIIAGIAAGIFAAPMKRMTKWEWENQWLMWAVYALLLTSWSMAEVSVPGLRNVFREAPDGIVLRTVLLGIGWGIGMVTFGLGLHLVGFSLGFSIILGATALTGSLIPMLVRSPGTLVTSAGAMVILGLVVTITGISFLGSAGMIRERSIEQPSRDEAKNRSRFILGFLVCLISAVFNSMANFAITFGGPITEISRNHISGPGVQFRATNPVLALGMTGAFIPNFILCAWLLARKGTWRNFMVRGSGSYWLWTLGMGVVWMGSFALYGCGTILLGKLGTTIGWITFFGVTVMTGNILGLVTGEWKGSPAKSLNHLTVGLLTLIIAISLVAYGGYLGQ